MFGDRLNIVVDNYDSDFATLQKLFAENNIKVQDMRLIPPSLENVFMHFIKGAN